MADTDAVSSPPMATASVRHFRDTPEDAVALRALLEAGLRAGELPDVTPQLVQPAIDHVASMPQHAWLALEGEEATLVGCYLRPFALLLVAPQARRRGHGRALVAAALAEVADPAEVELGPPQGNAGAEAFVRSIGFAYRSSSWRLRLPAAVALPAPEWPKGYVQRTYRPGVDDDTYMHCLNTAFAAHHPPLVLTPDLLARAQGRPDFVPENIALIVKQDAPDAAVAFARVVCIDDDREVRTLGVLPEARGIGLGRELLRWAVQRLRDPGAGDVTLDVEGGNTNALALYLRNGFEYAIEWRYWTQSPPSPAVEPASLRLP